MEFLEKEDFILINRLTTEEHGGNFVPDFNFLNENSLDYLLDAIKADLFGKELYLSLPDKAALYMFNVIAGHIFQDGNKRTGLEAALLFLKLNGKTLKKDMVQIKSVDGITVPETGDNANSILFHFTMEIASGKINLDACKRWFEVNIQS